MVDIITISTNEGNHPMFDILTSAMYDEVFMEEMDTFYQEIQIRDATPLSQHVQCPEYGKYVMEEFENGEIESLEGEVVTMDTIVGYGVNYKGEGVTAGLATLNYLKSIGAKS